MLNRPGRAAVNREALQLSDRLALTVAEAAEAVGVSERHLRTLLPEIPHTRLGERVVIPVKAFEEWLSKRAQAEKARADQVADEILGTFSSDEK
jgi:excisionase family DNA binding protein